MEKKYLNEIFKNKKFNKNSLIISPTGSGKTHYIINYLCKNKKVLYLCDNSNLEEQILLENNTRSLKNNLPKQGFEKTDITVMTYKAFGYKIKYDLDNKYINQFELIIADEIHNLIDYQTFSNDADLSHAIRALMKKYNKTIILMFTATPYYINDLKSRYNDIGKYFDTIDYSTSKEIKRYINKRESYINHISQIQFQLDEYRQSFEYADMKCLIYTTSISNMQFIEQMCIDKGLNPICIWSNNNKDYEMTEEQLEVRKYLIENGELKFPYNVLIINRATETGVNIYDKNMQLVIVNTTNLTQQVQARGRVRHDVDLLIVRTDDDKKVDVITIRDEYLNQWLLKVELENLVKEYGLKDDRGRLISVNKFINYLKIHSYQIEKIRKRINKKQETLYKINKI
ncbi:DEAD/DEAH box helicase family protein [Clostridioides difficile]|nr:DUF2075 domain-containing protein [Clostridioides difficile]EIS9354811.1 DEAD/DEAH box helicase family protein [Clostridioides difficile]MBN6006927.1 DEAD/DEAH box helicase family protein [Clostridioides difficile]MCM3861013.1 DEAD/DEAH box helicase family protein [Clostridioides difficile]MCP6803928.1 DEAD/DEAH box helicase family protein [Clostridioides difficile]